MVVPSIWLHQIAQAELAPATSKLSKFPEVQLLGQDAKSQQILPCSCPPMEKCSLWVTA